MHLSTHTYTRMCSRMRVRAHTHTYTHTNMHTRMHACIQQVCTRMHARTQFRMIVYAMKTILLATQLYITHVHMYNPRSLYMTTTEATLIIFCLTQLISLCR